jgi:small multidrug resistance pump
VGWLFLGAAILIEVAATLCLRVAVQGRKLWFIGVAVGYVISFTMLGLALNTGVPLGIAYGIWAASGVALTAILSRVIFKEPLTWLMLAGIGLIVAGVVVVELGAVH